MSLSHDAQILAWVTNPEAALRIAQVGRRLANENGLMLRVISIQNSVRTDGWEQTVRDLDALNSAARAVQAELGVIYSDNRMESAIKLMRELSPAMMVTGMAGDRNKNLFLENLRAYNPDVPVYAVDPSGNTIKLM